jgi:ATP-binding cassette subfamily B protein
LGIATVGSIATAYGLYSHIAGEISFAAALFMGAATGLFAARVATVSGTLGTWISSGFFVAEACSLQALSKKSKPREQELSSDQIVPWKSAPEITLTNVTVSASTHNRETDENMIRPILKNISINIRPGEFIGIVGCTGAGKTTLTKLLLGVRESSEGDIEFNGTPVMDMKLAELRANTSYLPQQWWNYAGKTVEQNIRIGNPIWDEDADVSHAVKNSGLKEVMSSNGFDLNAVVGQEFRNGRQLSGGEMQLVALASALAKKGRLLILDEPTSRLDPDTAESVVTHIKSLSDSTRVLVSHDMGLVRQCDRIIVMRKETDETSPGIIEAIGTHEELLDRSETYKRFFYKQAARFKD